MGFEEQTNWTLAVPAAAPCQPLARPLHDLAAAAQQQHGAMERLDRDDARV